MINQQRNQETNKTNSNNKKIDLEHLIKKKIKDLEEYIKLAEINGWWNNTTFNWKGNATTINGYLWATGKGDNYHGRVTALKELLTNINQQEIE